MTKQGEKLVTPPPIAYSDGGQGEKGEQFGATPQRPNLDLAKSFYQQYEEKMARAKSLDGSFRKEAEEEAQQALDLARMYAELADK